ncbi:MAG: hypothetical protein ACKOGC_05740 [Anaerolineae bacterium]
MKSSFSKVIAILMVLALSACNIGSPETPTEAVSETEVVTPEVPATEEPIVHTTIPSEPAQTIGNASDNDEINSNETFDVNFGDDLSKNRYERPFTVGMGSYLPEIDIVNFSIGEDDNFYYVTLNLGGLATAGQAPTGYYAIELDGNVDGRGELLIVANPSFGTEWSTNGVQIFADDNGDIGGDNVELGDANYTGDGYEKLMFDSGVGANPDLGWARFVNGEKPAIQIAFNKVIFPSTPTFMWSVWASANPFETTKFNLHDTTTEEAAGSPDKQNSQYPIKSIAGIDNSCRVPVGFVATGYEPLGCPVQGVADVENDDAQPSSSSNPSINIPANICQKYPALCNFNP